MEPKVNYARIGLFIALLGAGLVAGVLWLSRTDYRGIYDRYYTYMNESVSGLSNDSSVKYHGVDVGRVKEFVLNPNNPEQVRIALDLVRGTPVKEDTVAVLETQGLTGIATVNLIGGSRAAPILRAKAGEAFPVINSKPSFLTQLTGSLSRISSNEQLPLLLANLNSLTQDARGVLDGQSRAEIKQMLADLTKITGTLAAHRLELADAIAKGGTALDRFAALGKKLDDRLPEVLDQTSASVRSLREMTIEVARISASLNSALDGSRTDIAQFTGQTLPETNLLVAEVRQLTATLQRLASDLDREPSALIFGRARPVRGPGE